MELSVENPEHPCLKSQLAEGGRMAGQECFSIRGVKPEFCLEFMYDLTVEAGWNQTIADLARITRLSGECNFVAFAEIREKSFPLATGVCIPLGEDVCWIGMILVHREMRRQGIAKAMMRHCLAAAMGPGKTVHGLDATPEGAAVYRALGYIESYRIWRGKFTVSEFSSLRPAMEVVPVSGPGVLEAVLNYDTRSYFNRENIIRAMLEEGECVAYAVSCAGGEICGYTIIREGRLNWHLGPLVADDERCANALVTRVCRHLEEAGVGQVVMDVPEFHLSRDVSRRHRLIRSFIPAREFLRMYQVVNEGQAEKLAEGFSDQRLTYGSSDITHDFMAMERRAAKAVLWAITGPEKG